jgi:hypothetical protein
MNNIWVTWGDVFNASLQDLWWGFIQFAPKLLIAIIFFIVGWVVGSIVARALEQVFSALKVDRLFASVGADGFFRKAGMNLNTGHFIGELAKWFIVIVFLLPSLTLVGLDSIAFFLRDVVLNFLPQVIVAALVLVIATFVSEALSKTVRASAKTMSLTSANMLGTVTKYAVWVFAFIIALGELGVAAYYMSVLFTGIIAMISIGGALAFGLGGRDAAARFIDKVSGEISRN